MPSLSTTTVADRRASLNKARSPNMLPIVNNLTFYPNWAFNASFSSKEIYLLSSIFRFYNLARIF